MWVLAWSRSRIQSSNADANTSDYQLIRLGKAGYRAIMSNLTQTADFLAESILKIGDGKKFVLMSKGGKPVQIQIPRIRLTYASGSS